MLVLAAVPPHYLFLPISLNSLDRKDVRLLSPRDSQITSKRLQDEASGRYYVSFPDDQ